jgi:hypothetical protein
MKDKIIIDVAVLCQEYSPIEITCDNTNVTTLDDIEISEENFKALFYPYGENFGIDKNIASKKEYFPYIAFIVPYRTVNYEKFFLLETILKNIESDLNISRNCFTTTSIIELTNEIINLHSLCDINCCSVMASLPWSNIQQIIHNEDLSTCQERPIRKTLCFVISVIFKTPTPGVKPTMIKFPYVIRNI